MIYTKLNNVIKGFVLVLAMTFGLVLASSTNVNAQDYRYDRYGQNDRYNGRDRNGNQSVKFAYQKGYREGYQQGIQAARNGYRNSDRYSNNGYGNNGYNNGYGNNGYGNNSAWRQAYQNGFNRGYREGLNRNRNNRSGFTIRLPF